MKGYIYIASAFKTVNKDSKLPLDNDPHFWGSPATWGICRPDFRSQVEKGDYIFFVLPKYSEFDVNNQMIFGYIKVKENITHIEAFKRFPQKRMGNKRVNGNIIVDEKNNYNRFDCNFHKSNFDKIKKHYVIGADDNSRFLGEQKIRKLSKSFKPFLNQLFNTENKSIFEIIGRKGRRINSNQISLLLNYIE